MQKGQTLILILVGIVIIIAVAVGAYYLGRQTSPKPPSPPVVTFHSPQPTVTPKPNPDPELTFPSPCISPQTNPSCTEIATILRKPYNNLNELIHDSELIAVGRVLDSCLDKNSASNSPSWNQTPYIGHFVIERSLKNPLKLKKIFIYTAHLNEYFHPGSAKDQVYKCDSISLEPNKSYFLFLKKHPSGKFYWTTAQFEIQNSILMRHSEPADFEEEIIQLGINGLSERVSKLSQ